MVRSNNLSVIKIEFMKWDVGARLASPLRRSDNISDQGHCDGGSPDYIVYLAGVYSHGCPCTDRIIGLSLNIMKVSVGALSLLL